MGMETQPLRMDKHCANAMAVAQFLEKHPKVSPVSYAGLPSNKYNALIKKYCPKGAGSLYTFSCKGGYESVKKVVHFGEDDLAGGELGRHEHAGRPPGEHDAPAAERGAAEGGGGAKQNQNSIKAQ